MARRAARTPKGERRAPRPVVPTGAAILAALLAQTAPVLAAPAAGAEPATDGRVQNLVRNAFSSSARPWHGDASVPLVVTHESGGRLRVERRTVSSEQAAFAAVDKVARTSDVVAVEVDGKAHADAITDPLRGQQWA